MDNHSKFKIFAKYILPVFLTSLGLLIFLITLLMYFFLLAESQASLDKTTSRIQEDIIFKDGKWDLSAYNADSSLVDNNPLYIISSEGVVIERSRPINGLLDLSRFTLINQYLFPTTIESVSNERWRVLAKPIISDGQAIGIIFVSKYQPDDHHMLNIDQSLQGVIDSINQELLVKGDEIDVSQVDSRKLLYDINFQIVTRFNKVLSQSNNNNSMTRMPTNIDRSYVENQLKDPSYRQVTDLVTKQVFLISTIPIYNDKNLISGIIVAGVPLEHMYSSLKMFLWISSISGLLLLLLLIPITLHFFQQVRNSLHKSVISKPVPREIIFSKKECKLVINGEAFDIPYASFQYYFCQALIQKPSKRWEADELLELFGEDTGVGKWRKVYDTMVGLNKKTAPFIEKLFLVKDKRYFLNPNYIKISSFIAT